MGGFVAVTVVAGKATPTVPAIAGETGINGLVLTTVGTDATLIVSPWLTTPDVVVAWIVTGKAPLSVGVPTIWPPTKLRPVGNTPAVMAKGAD